MTTEVPGSIPWVIGILIAVVLALASVIAYLFKLNNARTLEHEKQRAERESQHVAERSKWLEEKASWDAENESEMTRLELQYETKHKEVVEHYVKQSAHDREQHLAREAEIRRDATELVDRISAGATASANKMADLLQKMHERLSGGRRRGG